MTDFYAKFDRNDDSDVGSSPQSTYVAESRSTTPEMELRFSNSSTSTSWSTQEPDRSPIPFDPNGFPQRIRSNQSSASQNVNEKHDLREAIRNIHAHASIERGGGHYDQYYHSPNRTTKKPNHFAYKHGGGTNGVIDDKVLAGTIQNIIADVMARKQANDWMRDVWRDDVESAFAQIADIAEQYNYVAIDTEFPGTILQHDDPSLTKSSLNYLDLRDNVNQLSVIQLGLTFSDKSGNRPKISTFQFNFKFDLRKEQHDPKSIHMLRRAGVDFDRHLTHGIDVGRFAEQMLASGLVLNDNIRWICFHGLYDFGYLSRVLSHLRLPDTPIAFFEQLYLFFPKLVDLKHQLRDTFSGGLNALAKSTGVTRCGAGHTGGSDSRLTSDILFKVIALDDREEAFSGNLFGLEPEEFTGLDHRSYWDQYPKRQSYNVEDYLQYYGRANHGYGRATHGYNGWYGMGMMF